MRPGRRNRLPHQHHICLPRTGKCRNSRRRSPICALHSPTARLSEHRDSSWIPGVSALNPGVRRAFAMRYSKPVMRPLALLVLLAAPALAAEKAAYDSNGRLIALLAEGEELTVGSSVVAVYPDGKRVPLRAQNTPMRRGPGLSWSGAFELPNGGRGRIDLKSEEDSASVRYSVTVAPENALEIAGLEFILDLPRDVFVNGRIAAQGKPAVPLAPAKPADGAFLRTETSGLRIESAGRSLEAAFDGARAVAVMDRWDTRGRSYQLHVAIEPGATFTAALHYTVAPAPAPPVRLSVDTSQTRYRFDGFGGDYCWNNASPVTAYTLDNLKIAWGRTEMKLLQWDKERDNPGRDIRADFETMRRFHQLGVPYVISIWWLPERFYTDAWEKPKAAHNRKIAPEKWDELLDLVGSYLLYAKKTYSVEPDLFSFNESNIGIYVGFTPEDHIEQIKRFGAHFRKLGLKTRMLLGDATGPRDTHTFVLAAANDPDALQFVGAVGFHSWGGGTPDQYRAWGDV